MLRTHYNNDVNSTHIGQTVSACGWVNKRRDHGGVIFIDLRDTTGMLQVVIDPDNPNFNLAESVRNEFCLHITGEVRKRPEGQENANLASGEVEVIVREFAILSASETPPFQLDDDASEEVRLRHRYIDLRRPQMQNNLRLRSRVSHLIRDFLQRDNYLEMETPMLTKATPEGARDYLVPSRVHEGCFYALPQSPQLFKQMLMMSGYDRYYQIVKCFRDEDLRADRQPEFTQVDIETSFMDEDDIMAMVERMFGTVFRDVIDVALPAQFPRMTYAEAMRRFGSDKPDMRIPLEFVDVVEQVKDCEFKVFAEPAKSEKGRVVALNVPKGSEKLTRKQIDEYAKFVERYGAKGLAYIKVNDLSAGAEGLQSPIIKFLGEDVAMAIMNAVGVGNGDLVFFGADKASVVNDAMGALRAQLGKDLDLLTCEWAPLWVTDFPMFEYDEGEKRYVAVHHPFTAPTLDGKALSDIAPAEMLSRAYDIVLNGYEVGGGSIRIHDTELQREVLALLGIDDDEANEKFGFLLNALKYGTPPHGGVALGLDRVVMLMAGADNIRDVIAFPKTQNASCLLTDAPSAVSEAQMQELHIRSRPKVDEI